jgi:hypothetical protein
MTLHEATLIVNRYAEALSVEAVAGGHGIYPYHAGAMRVMLAQALAHPDSAVVVMKALSNVYEIDQLEEVPA